MGKCMIKVFMLIVIVAALVLYVVRGAVLAQAFKEDTYDGKSISKVAASEFLVNFTFVACSFGFALAFFGLLHLWFWDKISGTISVGASVVALMFDVLAGGLAAKQEANSDKSTSNCGSAATCDVDSGLASLGRQPLR